MKKIFQISQVWVVVVMSVFLFSCEKSEMDSLVPGAQAETKKGGVPAHSIVATSTTQTADTAYIIAFYSNTPNLNTETDVQNLATSIAGAIQFDVTFFEDTKGFAAPLTPNQANAFRNDSRVEFVEIDGPIYPAGSN
ncbi:hypothetical protein I5M27_04795 [Adhaeribacter sp. BT258]|uniref:Inhibitor I9 domain-containing protein n=1 Tax=Adhaeribacter terrigena TaxID=2793070 RepID=A0ABS1C178_9BACT|nr:hypothetical protein [Adhaeribacter terrigena]MBK0402290.1 hypothetical protein [Adhaeribacter terrigena]